MKKCLELFPVISAKIYGGFKNCTRPGIQYPGTWLWEVRCRGDLPNPGNVPSLIKSHDRGKGGYFGNHKVISYHWQLTRCAQPLGQLSLYLLNDINSL